MIGHLRADAIRLGSRWDVRGFLLVVPLAAAAGFLASYATIENHYGWDPSQPMPVEVAARIAADRAGYAFPASLLTVLGNAPWLLFGLYFIAAGTVGLDFSWAAIKTSLISAPSRGRFVLSRIIAVGVIGVAALVLLSLVGLVMPGALPLLGEPTPPSLTTEPVVIAGAMGALLLSAAFFVSLGVLLGVVTRGPALPLLLLIADFVVEGVVTGLPLVREMGLTQVVASLPLMSVLNLISGAQDPTSYALPPATPFAITSPIVAERPLALSFVVVAAWTIAFMLLAVRQLRRADILE